jgi:hypothetical protein
MEDRLSREAIDRLTVAREELAVKAQKVLILKAELARRLAELEIEEQKLLRQA